MMEIRNYSHLDEGKIVDSNGQKHAIGIDDSGYLTILMGEVVKEKGEEFFWAYDKEKQSYTQIPESAFRKAYNEI